MAKKTTKADIVATYLSEYIDKDGKMIIAKQTLARIIFQKEVGLFPSMDVVRSYIRNLTGAAKGGMKLKQSDNFVPQKSSIKEGLEKYKLMTILPKQKEVRLGKGKWLILSDIHFPEHDAVALAAALEYGKEQNITGIVLNGDLLDMYGVASFDRETQRPTIMEEIEMARNFFALLREQFGDIPIYFKFGNHEERLRRFILRNAREIEGMHGLKLEEQLRCNEYKIKVVGREIIWAGKLALLHGHEFGHSIMAPVNPARGAFLRAKSSILIGHHHQKSEHREGNLKGDKIVAYSTGALCTLRPEYAPYGYTKWNLGFAMVDVKDGGLFVVRNHEIIDGEVY